MVIEYERTGGTKSSSFSHSEEYVPLLSLPDIAVCTNSSLFLSVADEGRFIGIPHRVVTEGCVFLMKDDEVIDLAAWEDETTIVLCDVEIWGEREK